MIRPPSKSTRTYTPFPYTSLFRSVAKPTIVSAFATMEIVVAILSNEAVEAFDAGPQRRRLDVQQAGEFFDAAGLLQIAAVVPRLRLLAAGHRAGKHVLGHVLIVEDRPARYCRHGLVARSEEHTSALQSLMRI